MPSKWEGFGLVALEAMSLGIPVLTSGQGALGTIVDGTCGRICKNAEEYAAAIKEILSDESLYQALSAGALERAKLYDNIGEYCDRLYAIYSAVCSR